MSVCNVEQKRFYVIYIATVFHVGDDIYSACQLCVVVDDISGGKRSVGDVDCLVVGRSENCVENTDAFYRSA